MGSMSRKKILGEIELERVRQDTKFGEQNLPSFDQVLIGNGASPERMAEHYEIPTEDRAKWAVGEMERRGDLTFADIALEEFAEVVGTCNMPESKTREELIQLAAVCVKWIECIDRRAANHGRMS